MDPSSFFVLFEVSVKLLNLVVAEYIDLLDRHCLSFFQVDPQINSWSVQR